MKTAVSIPDETFDAAEKAADRLGVSRSRLYADAINQYLAGMASAAATRQLDAVYTLEDSSLDGATYDLQTASTQPDSDW